MSNQELLYEVHGQVAWLILNRPDVMNATSPGVIELYEKYLPAIAKDDALRVLVLTGRGKAFCTGADLKALSVSPGTNGTNDMLLRAKENVLDVLRKFPKPVIASLNGLAIAGGLEMTMCADIVIASEEARLGDGHANFGVYPGGGGAAILPRLVPLNVAKYLLFTGRTLSAREMQGYGLVNIVVSPDELEHATQKLAEEISKKSLGAIQKMKVVANGSLDKTRDESLEEEQIMLKEHMKSPDFQEGLKAFSEKRKPNFL